MAFGKRHRPQEAAQKAPEAPVADAPASRYSALQERLLEVFAATAGIADAIRGDGSIHIRVVDEELRPEAGPISIIGFAEHFIVAEGAQVLHPFFVYVSPARAEHLDPSAQFQLHDIVTRIRDINTYCQRAALDDALAMALHAPGFPERIDRLLVGLAYFVAFFENLAQTQPFVTAPVHNGAQPDFASLKLRIERRLLMAEDRMLEPNRISELVPGNTWPHLGVEVLRRPEAGHEFIDGVYFPPELARQLAARRGRATTAMAEADTVAASRR